MVRIKMDMLQENPRKPRPKKVAKPKLSEEKIERTQGGGFQGFPGWPQTTDYRIL